VKASKLVAAFRPEPARPADHLGCWAGYACRGCTWRRRADIAELIAAVVLAVVAIIGPAVLR
jgi:hypothetical protein